MTRLATSFVLGYHGCDGKIARDAVDGKIDLLHSDREFDWLGGGIYFWENDPWRAREFAEWKASRGDYKEPTVIGAVVDLGNCLDLCVRENLELLAAAHGSLKDMTRASGLTMPKNVNSRGDPNNDRLLRFLDRAVINHLHDLIEDQPLPSNSGVEPYDSVRGLFTEGGRVYPGGKFFNKTHVQLAIRNHDCIKGVFWPRP